jgi:hypothetical protein
MRGPIAGILLTIIILVLVATCTSEAQPKRSWHYKGCYTRDCVTTYLNSLPSDVQVVITYDTDAVVNAYDVWVQR